MTDKERFIDFAGITICRAWMDGHIDDDDVVYMLHVASHIACMVDSYIDQIVQFTKGLDKCKQEKKR